MSRSIFVSLTRIIPVIGCLGEIFFASVVISNTLSLLEQHETPVILTIDPRPHLPHASENRVVECEAWRWGGEGQYM